MLLPPVLRLTQACVPDGDRRCVIAVTLAARLCRNAYRLALNLDHSPSGVVWCYALYFPTVNSTHFNTPRKRFVYPCRAH
jgi:hypothetical protein